MHRDNYCAARVEIRRIRVCENRELHRNCVRYNPSQISHDSCKFRSLSVLLSSLLPCLITITCLSCVRVELHACTERESWKILATRVLDLLLTITLCNQ